jgi:hypothetical protein
MYVDGAAGSVRGVHITTNFGSRWGLLVNAVAEGGANAGANLQINSYDNAGAYLGTPLTIERASGYTTLAGHVRAAAGFSTVGKVTAYLQPGYISQATGGSLELQTGTGYQSFLTFHISGSFAANFGMDISGNLYIGGWSYGNAAYQVWTTRDHALTVIDELRSRISALETLLRWVRVEAPETV